MGRSADIGVDVLKIHARDNLLLQLPDGLFLSSGSPATQGRAVSRIALARDPGVVRF